MRRRSRDPRNRPFTCGDLRFAFVSLIGLTWVANTLPAAAALTEAINAVRLHGCGGRPGATHGLRSAAKLDEAARRTAAGERLQDALRGAGYAAAESAEIRVSTAGGDAATARLLAQHFCAQIRAPTAGEIGVARLGEDTWIILATPLATPRPEDALAVSRRVLELVNEARAQPRRCGHELYGSAMPLKLSPALGDAALAHALDMAARDYFDHTGSDGSTPAMRVSRVGYAWRVVGENIAAGVATPEEAVAGWLQSPSHCRNVMDPRFTDMGAGYAVDPTNPSVISWTQVFAQGSSGSAHEPR